MPLARLNPKKKSPTVKKLSMRHRVFDSVSDFKAAGGRGTPQRLAVYQIRIMLDSSEVGTFGPYATVRAAASDAKNILRLNVGKGHKIVETGPVVPVIRSDERVKLYLHPESYSTQLVGEGILSAQVYELEPTSARSTTFAIAYGDEANANPRRRRPRARGTTPRRRNTSYGSGMDESQRVVVEGVRGMRSTPFQKTFRNFAAYVKWAESDAAANYSVHRVSNE